MSQILIAEDEKRIAAFLEKGLQKSGFKTAIAYDGEQALSMIECDDYDLLLLDIGLPYKDGWTVLRELRSRGKTFPVIVVTASDSLACQKPEIQAEISGYMLKPFRFKELLKIILSQIKF